MKNLIISVIIGSIAFLSTSTGVAKAQTDGTGGPSTRARLVASIQINGSYQNDGDVFQVVAQVKNVGSVTADNVRGELLNIPQGWIVSPSAISTFGNLSPGSANQFVYTVTRDAEDATIQLQATANNANTVTSRRVKVPINPVAIVGVVLAILGSSFLLRRRQPQLA